MKPFPDDTELLAGIRRFLDEELSSAVTGRSLRYRLRIASHLLGILERREMRTESPTVPAIPEDLKPDDEAWPDIWSRVKQALVADLALSNPSFDTSPDPEEES